MFYPVWESTYISFFGACKTMECVKVVTSKSSNHSNSKHKFKIQYCRTKMRYRVLSYIFWEFVRRDCVGKVKPFVCFTQFEFGDLRPGTSSECARTRNAVDGHVSVAVLKQVVRVNRHHLEPNRRSLSTYSFIHKIKL